ncbi:ADP-ribosyltransferase [Finegoldia sp. P3-F-LR]
MDDTGRQNAFYNKFRLAVMEFAKWQINTGLNLMRKRRYGKYIWIVESGVYHICVPFNNHVFDIENSDIGDELLPMHPRCRSLTIRYKPENYEKNTRTARDKDGKNIKVPLGMKYDEWKKWIDSDYKENAYEALTENEKRAIISYKSSESYKINEKLYNNSKLTNHDKKLIRNLDSALNKMPNYEGDLVRDLYFADNKSLNEFVSAHKVGNTISYKAYTSTTKADSYNDMANIKIYIKNSKMGKDISSIGLDEKEVLYQRNSEFLVADKTNIAGVNYIRLEEKVNV